MGRMGWERRAALRAVAVLVAALLSISSLLVAGASATALAAPDRTTKVIVLFEDGRGADARRAVRAAGGEIRFRYRLIDGFAASVPAAAIRGLRHNPNIVAVELDGRIEALDHTPNTGDLEYENAWGVEHIGSYRVHQAGIRGQGVRVAVIDTGIDHIHDVPPSVDPEFNGTYQGGWDFVNNDDDPMDDNGHGTHVAGSLAADHNGYLVVGVAPGVQLWGLKVLGASGSGDYSGLIAALDWAVANDMDLVNISLGGHDVSAALETAVHNAYAAGVTIVAAAGNTVTIQELLYGCPVTYPAAYPESIAVTFTGTGDTLTGYSCTGTQVDLAAPGDNIFAPVPVGSCPYCSSLGYRPLSGTSMASPHVAGVVALVLGRGIADANGDGLVADDVKAHLCATAATAASPARTDPRYAKWYGCGIVDADNALLNVPPPPPATGAPTAGPDTLVTPEDTPATINVLANDTDPDGDTLVVTAVTAPAHGTAIVESGSAVRYDPAPDYAGPDSFGYTVDDGTGRTATGTVSVTVTPVNDNPVALDDTLVTSRDVASTLAVLANDTDADGDALTVNGVTTPANGTAIINADSTITYVPATDYAGADGFAYTVSDGAGGSATGQVDVTVLAVNHPPLAVDDTATTAEDTPVTVDAAANDTDADGGALAVVAVGPAAYGTAALGPGGIVYTPDADFHGTDAFDYTVADGAGAQDSGQVTVEVRPSNDPPVAVDDAATTSEDTAVILDLAANDTDLDGDTLSVTGVGAAGAGSAVLNPDGTVTYTPYTNVYGTDTFEYTVGDGAGGSDTGTVTMDISPVNDPPLADARTVSTNYQTAVTVTLSGSDVETCDLGFSIVTPPASGTLGSISNSLCVTLLPPYADNAKVTYTPKTGFSGTDTFTYRTSDGSLYSALATVTVTVRPAVELHVGDLDASRTLQSSTWTARVTLRVDNASHAAVSGVTVTGTWSSGGTASCRTGSSGSCTVSKSKLPKSLPSVTFTVSGMTYATGAYIPTANHDPDGDSNGLAIVVNQ